MTLTITLTSEVCSAPSWPLLEPTGVRRPGSLVCPRRCPAMPWSTSLPWCPRWGEEERWSVTPPKCRCCDYEECLRAVLHRPLYQRCSWSSRSSASLVVIIVSTMVMNSLCWISNGQLIWTALPVRLTNRRGGGCRGCPRRRRRGPNGGRVQHLTVDDGASVWHQPAYC